MRTNHATSHFDIHRLNTTPGPIKEVKKGIAVQVHIEKSTPIRKQ